MKKNKNIYGISNWYLTLADYTFPTTFVKLRESDVKLIADGVNDGDEVSQIKKRISNAQKAFTGATFISADIVVPTDTERFRSKKGSVHSAQSAWDNLVNSKKVRKAAADGRFEYLCIRPFRNMTHAREFRLFICEGELKLMSQYWLYRKFYRLDDRRETYWNKAKDLVEEISWLLPSENVVLDIYFTSGEKIILIDFNKWGEPTRPLLAETWNLDWDEEHGIKILEKDNA
ncbi:MAG: cell division cycle 123 family protein [Victivallales bacterium]|nr:cell division cycle 123 family protein [Victivallales bacterium]